jgi:hypothetical protein
VPSDVSEIVLVEGSFGKPPARVPCKECPLARASTPGYLGGYTPEMYLAVLHGPADIACHMSKGFPANRSEQRSCTGVAMYRANVGHWPAGANAADAVAWTGQNMELAFATADEFKKHHEGKSDLQLIAQAERPKCSKCGLEDGACICAHITQPPKEG